MATGGEQQPQQRESRVHFPDDQVAQHDSQIVIEQNRDGHLDVHLGFLQLHYRYQIKIAIKDSLGESVMWNQSTHGLAHLIEARATSGGKGHDLVLEFRANREKLMTDEVTLRGRQNDKTLTLNLHARVLGLDKGTPVLREGIHCIDKEDSGDADSKRSEFVKPPHHPSVPPTETS